MSAAAADAASPDSLMASRASLALSLAASDRLDIRCSCKRRRHPPTRRMAQKFLRAFADINQAIGPFPPPIDLIGSAMVAHLPAQVVSAARPISGPASA